MPVLIATEPGRRGGRRRDRARRRPRRRAGRRARRCPRGRTSAAARARLPRRPRRRAAPRRGRHAADADRARRRRPALDASPSPSAGRRRCSAASRSSRARSSRPRRRSGRTSSCRPTSPIEQEGTITNLEGRTQRLRAVVPPPAGVAPELARARRGRRHLGLELEPSPVARVRAASPRPPRSSPADLGVDRQRAARRCPPAARAPSRARAGCPPPRRRQGDEGLFTRSAAAPALLGRRRSRAPSASRFQRARRDRAAHDDAARLGHRRGRRASRVRHAGGDDDRARAHLAHGCAPGAVRFAWDGAPVDGAARASRGAR